MAWIELHDDLPDHYKLEMLADKIGVPKVYAAGHLVFLWLFTLRSAWRDADLSNWGDRGIERAAGWMGEPGKFANAARETGWLEGGVVHGWMERAGDLVWKRLEREGKRSRGTNGHRTATEREATVPYPTVPTVPNKTDIAPSPLDSSPAYLTFRCAGSPGEWTLTEAKLAEYSLSFPAVDVRAECRKAWQWTVDHPRQIKTARGMPAFLGRWLGKAQDSGGSHGRGKNGAGRLVGAAATTPGKFDAIDG